MKFWSNSEVPEMASQVPEKRLLAAVLQRAITDFFTGEGDLRENAETWLMNDEVPEAPLSYVFVCEALDIDAAGLRAEISAQAAGKPNPNALVSAAA